MLCQFSFKNFSSYKNETVFDFQATNVSEFEDSCISQENGSKLLPVSVIYGPNGGGKSNLIKALSCVISIVVQPIVELNKNRINPVIYHTVNCTPFLFDDISKEQPTEFQLFFRVSKNEYRYNIALLQDQIIYESLYRKTTKGKKTALIFEREEQKIALGSSINKRSINKEINPKMPYLSFLAINYDIPDIAEVQSWFESCIIRNYANFQIEHNLILPSGLINKTNDAKKLFITAMNDMGIDISGYRFDADEKMIFLQHSVNGQEYELPFTDESEGTKKVFAVLPMIMMAIIEGRLIVVDELDSKLHPKLLRYIISLFTNRKINSKGAQLLFSSHDTYTMRNDVFRRDEIWFAAMDKNRSSELYALSDIRDEKKQRVNHTASYDKQYLEGRYGADPYLRAMLDWEAIAV